MFFVCFFLFSRVVVGCRLFSLTVGGFGGFSGLFGVTIFWLGFVSGFRDVEGSCVVVVASFVL